MKFVFFKNLLFQALGTIRIGYLQEIGKKISSLCTFKFFAERQIIEDFIGEIPGGGSHLKI
jgi:hypothetical protein